MNYGSRLIETKALTLNIIGIFSKSLLVMADLHYCGLFSSFSGLYPFLRAVITKSVSRHCWIFPGEQISSGKNQYFTTFWTIFTKIRHHWSIFSKNVSCKVELLMWFLCEESRWSGTGELELQCWQQHWGKGWVVMWKKQKNMRGQISQNVKTLKCGIERTSSKFQWSLKVPTWCSAQEFQHGRLACPLCPACPVHLLRTSLSLQFLLDTLDLHFKYSSGSSKNQWMRCSREPRWVE